MTRGPAAPRGHPLHRRRARGSGRPHRRPARSRTRTRYSLIAQVTEAGAEPVNLGVAPRPARGHRGAARAGDSRCDLADVLRGRLGRRARLRQGRAGAARRRAAPLARRHAAGQADRLRDDPAARTRARCRSSRCPAIRSRPWSPSSSSCAPRSCDGRPHAAARGPSSTARALAPDRQPGPAPRLPAGDARRAAGDGYGARLTGDQGSGILRSMVACRRPRRRPRRHDHRAGRAGRARVIGPMRDALDEPLRTQPIARGFERLASGPPAALVERPEGEPGAGAHRREREEAADAERGRVGEALVDVAALGDERRRRPSGARRAKIFTRLQPGGSFQRNSPRDHAATNAPTGTPSAISMLHVTRVGIADQRVGEQVAGVGGERDADRAVAEASRPTSPPRSGRRPAAPVSRPGPLAVLGLAPAAPQPDRRPRPRGPR